MYENVDIIVIDKTIFIYEDILTIKNYSNTLSVVVQIHSLIHKI